MKYLQLTAAILIPVTIIFSVAACQVTDEPTVQETSKMDIIFDTDANNEVDDQHALAYLLFSGDHFKMEGVTVNATSAPSGYSEESNVSDHYEEAKRVMQLCGNLYGKIPLKTGANGSFEEIKNYI